MRTFRRLLPALASLALVGCMEDPLAGNTTQTENTVMAIRVDSILPPWNRPCCAPTVATLRLDSTNFPFERTDSSGLDLVVLSLHGDSIPFEVVHWDKPARLGRLQVRIDWTLRLPAAKFLLRWREPLARRGDSVAVWKGIPDSQRLAISSVLVDDFEGSTTKSLLPSGASWYSGAPDSTVPLGPLALVSAGGGRAGKAIHLGYTAPSSTGKYALVGIALGSGGDARSLRSLDSLVVWVRGTGKLAVALDRLVPGDKGKAWVRTTLDGSWTRLRIRPQDFDPPSEVGNNVGWERVRDAVTNLSFLASDGSDLFVDEVRFHGVDREDLR